MKEIAGHKEVPLYDDRPVKHDEGFNEPHAKMKMADYVDLLKSGPTKYRIFLWNILKEVPELQNFILKERRSASFFHRKKLSFCTRYPTL